MKNFLKPAMILIGIMLIAIIGYSADFKEVKKEFKHTIENIQWMPVKSQVSLDAMITQGFRVGDEVAPIVSETTWSITTDNEALSQTVKDRLHRSTQLNFILIDKCKLKAAPRQGYRRIEYTPKF